MPGWKLMLNVPYTQSEREDGRNMGGSLRAPVSKQSSNNIQCRSTDPVDVRKNDMQSALLVFMMPDA